MKKISLMRVAFLSILLGIGGTGVAYADEGSNAGSSEITTQGVQTDSSLAAQAMTPININNADAQTLAEVKGLGPKRAEAIVKYRDEHGSFSSIEDLQKVSGIGPGVYRSIESHVTVGN